MSTFYTTITIPEGTIFPHSARLVVNGKRLAGSPCPQDLYFKVPFDSSETVLQVKEHIEGKIAVPAHTMILTYAGDTCGLPNDQTLFRCGVQSMSTLTLTFRIKKNVKKAKGKADRERVRVETKRVSLREIERELHTISERIRRHQQQLDFQARGAALEAEFDAYDEDVNALLGNIAKMETFLNALTQ